MRSKAYYSNLFSAPLAWENLKRFWTIAVVGLLVYLLSGAFPLLLSYDRIQSSLVEGMLRNQNPGYMAAHLFLAISAALAVFRYLQSTGSASVMHAMPFSRKGLYLSSYGSGLLLAYAPALVNGLVLLLLKTPVYRTVYEGSLEAQVDVFTSARVLQWMGESFVIIAFLYSIAVFAGMVTGSVVLHALTALGFNFLLTALYATFLGYSEIYFFGFAYNELISEITLKLSPYTYVFEHGGAFEPGISLIFLAAAALISAGTYFIYKKRPLEKAGDSTVFRFMEYFLSFLAVFFASSLVGMIFHQYDYGYTGYVLGGLLGFLVGQMIVKKTMKIFNGENLRAFVVFSVIMAVIVTGFRMDALGYERRVPEVEQVRSAAVSSNELAPGHLPSIFLESANVQSILDFHQAVVEERAVYRKDPGPGFNLTLTYELKNGKQMSRQYDLPYAAVMESEPLAKAYESLEADAAADKLAGLSLAETQIAFYPGDYSGKEPLMLHYSDDGGANQKKRSLLEALALDLKEMTFRERLSARAPVLQLEILHRAPYESPAVQPAAESYPTYPQEKGQGNYQYDSYSFQVTRAYRHTLGWLAANGYEGVLATAGEGDFALITRNTLAVLEEEGVTVPRPSWESKEYGSYYEKPSSGPGLLLLEDTETITRLIQEYAYLDLRHFENEQEALCLTLYRLSDYQDAVLYETSAFYYLDQEALPEGVLAEVNRYLGQ